MAEDDIRYYQARAEQELALAQEAKHPQAAQAHFTLAGCYLDIVHSSPFAPGKPPPLLWQ